MERIATVKFIACKKSQTRGGMSAILKYCSQDKKTVWNNKKLVSGMNVVAQSSYSEMMNTKHLYRKTGGRMFYHLIQSFHPDEDITPETAHEIGLKLANEIFKGYEVQVATHSDTVHIHNHFVVNSVSFENGLKYHSDKDEIQRIRDYSDKLCKGYGLSVLKPKKSKVKNMSAKEYRVADRGQSWKLQLAITIDEAMQFAVSREHFISLMENEGYEVTWTDKRKNITYTTPNDMKCRDNKLHEEKYLKEAMEYEFINRKEIIRRIKEPVQDESAESREHTGVCFSNTEQLGSIDKGSRKSDRDGGKSFSGSNEQEDNERISQTDTGNQFRPDRAAQGNTEKLPDNNGQDNSRMFTEFETDSDGYYLTGWETERELFRELLENERTSRENYEVATGYSVPAYSNTGSMVSDTAYLIAGLMNIIEEPEKKDHTDMQEPEKERKNYDRDPRMRM